MNNQYINNSTEEEQPKGFNKTGVLLLKNRIDKIEYHLYNNKLPQPICVESIDINEVLNQYLYGSIKQLIHMEISSGKESIFKGTGKLIRKIEDKIEKFYFIELNNNNVNYFDPIFSQLVENDGMEQIITDLELLLFDNCDKTINIKIYVIHNEETDEVKEGENKVDEPREEQS